MVLGKVNSYYLCKSRFHWNIVKAVFVFYIAVLYGIPYNKINKKIIFKFFHFKTSGTFRPHFRKSGHISTNRTYFPKKIKMK